MPEFAVLGRKPLLAGPRVGLRRELTAAQVRTLARGSGVPLSEAQPVCFVRPGRSLTEAEVVAALGAVLAARGPFELASYPRELVPQGTLVFDTRAQPVARNQTLVRGWVEERSGERFPVWARVREVRLGRWLELREPLAPGQRIAPENVRIRQGRLPVPEPEEPERLLGKVARRSLPEGTVLRAAHTLDPPLVERGRPVRVEADVGGAIVAFTAVAESAARLRDPIFVQSPGQGRRLRAVVTGEGQARIEPRSGGRK